MMRSINIGSSLVIGVGCALMISAATAAAQVNEPETFENDSIYDSAAEYSASVSGEAFLVYRDGTLVYEVYQNGYDGAEPHLLASGTKSFSCAIAVLAIQDGLLTLDERVADTITEWADDPERSQITVRHLLSLTSGLSTGRGQDALFRTPDNASTHINETELASPPGEGFYYGPANYYVFAELMRRKLNGEDAWEYLNRRLLEPIGLEAAINRDRAGTPALPGGARLTARNWARYGQLILQDGMWNREQLLDPALMSECFIGSNANIVYGLTWWLYYSGQGDFNVFDPLPDQPDDGIEPGVTEPNVIVAAGAGNQRLYIIPEANLVIVRFAQNDPQFSDVELINRITSSGER